MALTYRLRPINQQKCFDKAKNKTEFLIAAKCRFGKTFVAAEIAIEGWHSEKLLVISGMKSVEDEWKNLIKKEYPNFKNFTFTTVQALNDSDRAKKIIAEYKKCTIIFDEAHFSEQTDRTQEIIKALNPSRKLYLTATPYTCSLVKQFSKENQFNYSIQDEFEDYFKDPENFVKENRYTPVSVSLSILQSNELYENTKGIEVWTKAAWQEFKKELDSKNYKTFIYFVQNKKQADEVKKAFEKFDELKGHICQLSGIENEKGSEESDEESTRRYYGDVKTATEKCYEAKQKNEYFCIIACKRGGTGVTFKGLDCVAFYNAPNSAIDFIQKSYRCANPAENKTKATVYCFNKESALSVYLRTNQLEAARKGRDPKDNFEDFRRFFTNEVVAFFEVDEYKTNENYVSYQKEDLYEIYMGRIDLDTESPEVVTMELKSQPYTREPESISLLKKAGLIADNPEYGNGSEDRYIALKDTKLMVFIIEECRQTTLNGKDYIKNDQLPTAYSDPEARALSVQQLKAGRAKYKQDKAEQRRRAIQAGKLRAAERRRAGTALR